MFRLTKKPAIHLLVASMLVVASTASADTFAAINYGAASASEQNAFDSINDFRAEPQNELYDIFQAMGYGAGKAAFDSLLSGQTTHTSNFWGNTFGGNIVTNSMDFFGTVPATIKSQFDALPSAGSLSPYQWSDNLGWSANQYASWIENDAGATNNPHAIPGAPGLGARFTNAGVNWTAVGENIAANWPNNPDQMHAGFAIDWGTGVDGIQSPPGHRNAMLNIGYTHIGSGIVDAGWVAGNITQVQHLANQFSTDPIFYGYVTDELTGNELAAATVSLFDSGDTLLGTATTDARGAYTIQYSGGTPDYAQYTALGRTVNSSAIGSSGSNYYLDAAISAVPEPSSLLALTLIGGMSVLRRRRNGGTPER